MTNSLQKFFMNSRKLVQLTLLPVVGEADRPTAVGLGNSGTSHVVAV